MKLKLTINYRYQPVTVLKSAKTLPINFIKQPTIVNPTQYLCQQTSYIIHLKNQHQQKSHSLRTYDTAV